MEPLGGVVMIFQLLPFQCSTRLTPVVAGPPAAGAVGGSRDPSIDHAVRTGRAGRRRDGQDGQGGRNEPRVEPRSDSDHTKRPHTKHQVNRNGRVSGTHTTTGDNTLGLNCAMPQLGSYLELLVGHGDIPPFIFLSRSTRQRVRRGSWWPIAYPGSVSRPGWRSASRASAPSTMYRPR